MKKILSILCVAILAVTVSSCKKETVISPDNNFSFVEQVPASRWTVFNSTTNTVSIDVPEIDDYANEHYAILVYMALGDNAPWEQVPETYEGTAFSFTHNIGNVSIYQQNATGTGTPVAPSNAYFKVVIVKANP
ncbi:hypothetical protein D0C36_09905 [Mucilaginibacter conchicola]|uniref:Uncharacterized protein n=1 Tax=Mucilaginibacter conchicola TaxID=2303333 RepID=A0A372NRK1_9SPHI|nr:hypothetical protein [Mucilaginibacter conchicola]RFZ91762.1 hypothetical protein D0C36_09905 [Mucilaginibacter conchicola]